MTSLSIQSYPTMTMSLLLSLSVLLLAGCGGETTATTDTGTGTNVSPVSPAPPAVIVNEPLSLATSGWPVIHQNNAGSKSGAFAAPIDSDVSTDKWLQPNSTVLTLIGANYIYHQAASGGLISAFKPDDLANGPVHQVDLNAVFRTGGGIIDSNQRLWWTSDDRLVRLEEDLSGAIYSESLAQSIAASLGNASFPYLNGTTLLSDSNILVSSVAQYAWVVSTTVDQHQQFPLISQINWQTVSHKGVPILANETQFSPRPIIDDNGDIVIVSADYMLKLRYNSQLRTFDQEAIWAFANPENTAQQRLSSLAVSHAVQLNNLICVASAPLSAATVQQVYCVDAQTGQLLHQLAPFPHAFGAKSLHTLGGLADDNWLVTVVNATDNTGGMRVFDLNTGLPLGEPIVLNDISEAFTLSAQNKHAYIAYKTAPGELAVAAVNLTTGNITTLYSSSLTDNRSIVSGLAPSLSALGMHGLYMPLPDGLVRISTAKDTVWRGNHSLNDENWRQQWGLVAWDEQRKMLFNGFWGENDIAVVAAPYYPDHGAIKVHYAMDGVTTESGVGMLFFPDIELADPKKACLSYKQLFDKDFEFGTAGGKLPGLYGFNENAGLTLDATVCAGPYAYDSDSCFSARLGFRNLSAIGYPATTMFYEVIPWMDETECRDSWICDLPYGEGMTMRTAEPESFMALAGQWTQIEQEIQLNDEGKSNGYIRIWYQGRLVVDERDLSIVTSDAVSIKGVLFHSLFGQGFDLAQGSLREQDSYIADVEIANSCGKSN